MTFRFNRLVFNADAGAGAGGAAAGAAEGAADAGAAGAAGAGAAAPHWTASLNDDLKGWATTKGFDKQDPGAVVDSYRNLEKLTGDPASLIKLPKDDDAEAWNQVYNKLGRPEKADGYDVKVPEGGSEEFAGWAKGVFHEIGLTAKQGAALAAKWNEYATGTAKAQGEAAAAATAQAVAALKTEWGAAYDQNAQIVDRAAERLGVSSEHLEGLRAAMGPAGAMKFLHGLAVKLGEDKFVGGDGGNAFGVMTPAAAKAEIEALRRDPEFVRKYTAGGHEERKKLDRLHAMAYPAPVA